MDEKASTMPTNISFSRAKKMMTTFALEYQKDTGILLDEDELQKYLFIFHPDIQRLLKPKPRTTAVPPEYVWYFRDDLRKYIIYSELGYLPYIGSPQVFPYPYEKVKLPSNIFKTFRRHLVGLVKFPDKSLKKFYNDNHFLGSDNQKFDENKEFVNASEISELDIWHRLSPGGKGGSSHEKHKNSMKVIDFYLARQVPPQHPPSPPPPLTC